MRHLLLLSLLFSLSPSYASYRAYKLRVLHYTPFGAVSRRETVVSMLDPYQYEHYHAGYRWDRVELVDTWYCPGDTHRRPICKAPRVREWEYTEDKDKRVSLPYTRQPIIP